MAVDIERMKNIGNFQATFMWHISIPQIPFVGGNTFEFQARSTTIPGKTLNTNLLRYLGKQFKLPGAVSYDGDWTVTVIMSEVHELYDAMIRWGDNIPANSVARNVQSIKTSAYIQLMALDGVTVNKRFVMDGMFITNYPEISGLDQSATEGHINYDLTFSYDDINFDYENALTF